jgi:protein-S-isoprenylcysteine O-methyltransferase Ste14
MYLSDWTATDTHIGKRAILQSLAWAVLLFWLFPSLIFNLTADNWSGFLQRDTLTMGLFLLPLLLPAYLLISALYHFAVQGEGTAFPYDPPKKLVTQGVYRYISNPMQVGISLAMGWWGVVIQSLWVSISAVIAVILFIVFKDVCNGSCAIGKNNPDWEEYQRTVPKWYPKFNSYKSK